MIVADASLLAHLLIPGLEAPLAESVLILDAEWRAPGLWRYELKNVLLKSVRARALSEAVAEDLMVRASRAMDGAEQDAPSAAVMATAHALAISAYDAEYVALAHELGVPLVTFDRKLAKAARGIALLPADFVAAH